MEPYPFEVVTASVGRVVDTAEMREYLRFDDGSYEEQTLANILEAAEDFVEKNCGKQLLTATYDWKIPCFYAYRIHWPKPPLNSITSVTYVDTSGTSQTLSTSLYDVITGTEHAAGYVKQAYNETWPTTRGDDLDVTIRGVCGFGDKDAVPETFRHQIRLLAKHWFEHRSAVECGQMSRAELAYDALQSHNMRHEFI